MQPSTQNRAIEVSNMGWYAAFKALEQRIYLLELTVGTLQNNASKTKTPKPEKQKRKRYRDDIIDILKDGTYRGYQQMTKDLAGRDIELNETSVQATLISMANGGAIKRISFNCYTHNDQGVKNESHT